MDQVAKRDVARGVHVGAAAAEHIEQGVNIGVVDSAVIVDVTSCFNAGQNLARLTTDVRVVGTNAILREVWGIDGVIRLGLEL